MKPEQFVSLMEDEYLLGLCMNNHTLTELPPVLKIGRHFRYVLTMKGSEKDQITIVRRPIPEAVELQNGVRKYQSLALFGQHIPRTMLFSCITWQEEFEESTGSKYIDTPSITYLPTAFDVNASGQEKTTFALTSVGERTLTYWARDIQSGTFGTLSSYDSISNYVEIPRTSSTIRRIIQSKQ